MLHWYSTNRCTVAAIAYIFCSQAASQFLADKVNHKEGIGGLIRQPHQKAISGDIGIMHEWWCEKYPSSDLCEIIQSKKRGEPGTKPSPEAIVRMHHEYCHAGLETTSDTAYVHALLPDELSFAHALPVPATLEGEALHKGRSTCKAHDVDRMQAWWCRGHPSSVVCSILTHRRTVYAHHVLVRLGDARAKTPPPKYEASPADPAELRAMHDAWCGPLANAETEPCRRFSEVRDQEVRKNSRDRHGAEVNRGAEFNREAGREGREQPHIIPRYQRSPHFRAAPPSDMASDVALGMASSMASGMASDAPPPAPAPPALAHPSITQIDTPLPAARHSPVKTQAPESRVTGEFQKQRD